MASTKKKTVKTTKAKARTGNARARSTATKDRLDDAKATRKEIANEEKLAKIRAKDARTEIQKQKGATHGIGFWRRSRRSRR